LPRLEDCQAAKQSALLFAQAAPRVVQRGQERAVASTGGVIGKGGQQPVELRADLGEGLLAQGRQHQVDGQRVVFQLGEQAAQIAIWRSRPLHA